MRQLLRDDHCLSEAAADDLVDYLRRQRGATGGSLPHRHHLLIEHFREAGSHGGHQQVIVHANWGGSVLRPWAIALAAAWQKRFGSRDRNIQQRSCAAAGMPGDISAAEI